jgi:uncharacterized protein YacL (UPF0231 family)
MQTIELNQWNNTFRIPGNEKSRAIELHNIQVEQWPVEGKEFNLLVIDEKEVTIHSEPLNHSVHENREILPINKRFAFYDHISVMVSTGPEKSPFRVIVYFI